MGALKQVAAKIWANRSVKRIAKWANNPVETQNRTLRDLMDQAKDTAFGQDHDFANVKTFKDLAARVPIRDYEALRPYVDRMVDGAPDILWPGRPLYYAKTSGTTSGAKFIPISKTSMPYHVASARDAIFNYIQQTGRTSFLDGKMIFLQGSPELEDNNGVDVGRLSGISAHFVPSYLQSNRLPSWETNCIEDWEEKVEAIVQETKDQNMTVISGIPPWVQMYFERLLEVTGKQTIREVFPNLEMFVTGGVAYEPYRKRFEALIGGDIPVIQTYPASEGFFAYQDQRDHDDLLLLLDNGMAYEFVPADHYFDENPPRLSIGEVELGVNYALILHTNAGLWGYSIGDTIEFVSKDPYRVRVTGRIKHFISAFGEHVIGAEVEHALKQAVETHGGKVREFTVAPQVNPADGGLPYHEWFVAFDDMPDDVAAFAQTVDAALAKKNSYYNDLIEGGVLKACELRCMAQDAFIQYMKSVGKLGGQNKVPRLTNDRKIADALGPWII